MGVILFSWQLSAQLNPEKIKLGVMAGYAFYQQDDLKSVNREILSQLPFESQIIDNFDPVFFFGGYAQYELFSHFYIGPAYEYRYTGSRLGTKDYSGIYSFDQYVKAHQIGLKFDYSLVSLKKIVFNVQLNGGAGFTDWKMDSNLEIGEEVQFRQYNNYNCIPDCGREFTDFIHEIADTLFRSKYFIMTDFEPQIGHPLTQIG